MGLASTTVKHLLLLLNFIFVVLGLVLIAFGIFFLVSVTENAVSIGENVAGGLIIGLGVVILIISIFGCLAAIHEARVRLLIYVIAVVLLILTQLLFLSMASHGTKDGISGSINEGFERLWDEEQKESGALAYYEEWLQCCGVNSPEDYWIIKHAIPITCCADRKCIDSSSVHQAGCKAKFVEYLDDKLLTFKIVSWLLIIGETIGAVFGWMLLSSLKNQSRRNNAAWM
ncbi:leukocyte surface antigen CD53 [Scaptodrosophila lebanonensis]|uniref:Tetraspanin n=1 Tax=Drosophila lebanonensis TaxID=7225 RepID=A0A6J2UG02_DROLE|nr:leukocyte surface antigen CD53 [Scaptodrosophila lebanonensis]